MISAMRKPTDTPQECEWGVGFTWLGLHLWDFPLQKLKMSIPSAHKLLPSKLFFEIILSGNPQKLQELIIWRNFSGPVIVSLPDLIHYLINVLPFT